MQSPCYQQRLIGQERPASTMRQDCQVNYLQVCGANAGQLLLAASSYRGDWDAGEVVLGLSRA